MFYRIRRKIKQSDGRNQVKRKLLSLNSLLATMKRFATAKKRLRRNEALESKDEASGSPQQREHKSKDNSQIRHGDEGWGARPINFKF